MLVIVLVKFVLLGHRWLRFLSDSLARLGHDVLGRQAGLFHYLLKTTGYDDALCGDGDGGLSQGASDIRRPGHADGDDEAPDDAGQCPS